MREACPKGFVDLIVPHTSVHYPLGRPRTPIAWCASPAGKRSRRPAAPPNCGSGMRTLAQQLRAPRRGIPL